MTKIEWTKNKDGNQGKTWNPVVGCSILSPGCTNCYAMKMAARIEKISAEAKSRGVTHTPHYDGTTKQVNGKPVWTGRLAMADDGILLQPLKRKKPTTYFVNSMGDLFHEDCPDEWIDKVFAVMALAPQHTFQVLTKRAQRMRDYCNNARVRAPGFVEHACGLAQKIPGIDTSSMRYLDIVYKVGAVYPLPNVWLGVSTERQQEADERIPLLLQTPAAVRFISAEPLLGPIDLTNHCNGHYFFNSLTGTRWHDDPDHANPEHKFAPGLDWVIVGGESGPGARPMHPDWARSIRDQCQAAGVKFFFKQWGAHAPSFSAKPAESIFFDSSRMVACSKKAAGRLIDGVEHNEMPERR